MIKAKTIKNKNFVEKSVEVEALVIPLHLSPRQLKRGVQISYLVAHEPSPFRCKQKIFKKVFIFREKLDKKIIFRTEKQIFVVD